MNVLFIPFVLMTLLFLSTSLFAFWAYSGRQDYKNNADEKIEAAVEVARQETASAKDKEYAEANKSPLKTFVGPATFGSLSIQYPKTWSAVIEESGRGGTPISGYFHPDYVPGLDSDKAIAMRFEVVESGYAQELKKYDTPVKSGAVKVGPYAAAKVPNVVGARVDGEIFTKQKGVMILLPLRDKTIKIWTESDQFQKDFNQFILPSLSFTP